MLSAGDAEDDYAFCVGALTAALELAMVFISSEDYLEYH